jgi:hypothetical protein
MSIGSVFGELTGLGGSGNPEPHNIDPGAYDQLFQAAMSDLGGMAAPTSVIRKKLQGGVEGQLDQLDNNAAGRKKNFEEDMSRSFGNDIQTRARAAGGTGNLAQSLSPTGAMYGAQARATARGYNDLYSQATQDLGSLSGIQSGLYAQDSDKAKSDSNLKMGRLNQLMGIGAQNNENTFNSEQAGRQRRMNTFSGVSRMAGGLL